MLEKTFETLNEQVTRLRELNIWRMNTSHRKIAEICDNKWPPLAVVENVDESPDQAPQDTAQTQPAQQTGAKVVGITQKTDGITEAQAKIAAAYSEAEAETDETGTTEADVIDLAAHRARKQQQLTQADTEGGQYVERSA